MMGFQDTGIVGGSRTGSSFHYHKLECQQEDGAASRRRWWKWLPLPALQGKPAPPCFLRVKKLKWSSISSALLPKKAAEFPSKIRHAEATSGADVCPVIVFMSPWGLPVLSRPLLPRNKDRQGIRVSPWMG